MFKTIENCELQLVASTKFVEGASQVTEEFLPVMAARVSFGADGKTGASPKADVKLMKYLADNHHLSPFEHLQATFLIECPLFVRSQIHRHRTFAYNEISRRYTEENLEFWIPTTFRGQADSNRQASSDAVITELTHEAGREDLWGDLDNKWEPKLHYEYKHQCDLDFYNLLLKSGVAREQARAALPQSLLTKFYMTGNLRNWVHFVKLRLDSHAQEEVRVVAQRIDAELRKLWPTAWGVLMEGNNNDKEKVNKEAAGNKT